MTNVHVLVVSVVVRCRHYQPKRNTIIKFHCSFQEVIFMVISNFYVCFFCARGENSFFFVFHFFIIVHGRWSRAWLPFCFIFFQVTGLPFNSILPRSISADSRISWRDFPNWNNKAVNRTKGFLVSLRSCRCRLFFSCWLITLEPFIHLFQWNNWVLWKWWEMNVST